MNQLERSKLIGSSSHAPLLNDCLDYWFDSFEGNNWISSIVLGNCSVIGSKYNKIYYRTLKTIRYCCRDKIKICYFFFQFDL